jgi:hypothetical protein
MSDPQFDHGVSSRRVVWEIETKKAWSDYTASVEGLLAGYECVLERDLSVSFVKPMRGDTFSVALERLADSPRLKVRVAFVARAD